MFRSSKRLSSRAFIALTLSGATLSAAGAATFHRFATAQGTGSAGSVAFLQSGTGSALQGEVGPAFNTSVKQAFGVLGDFNPSSTSTFGSGVLGVSTTGYGVAGQSTTNQPSIIAYSGGAGIGLQAIASQNTAILGQTAGDGYGVEGTNTAVEGYDTAQEAGVYGEDLSSPSPGGLDYSTGVIGETRRGYSGVYGIGDTGSTIGVSGFSTEGNGVLGISQSSSGIAAVEATNQGTFGDGVDSDSTNNFAFNGTAGPDSALALYNDSSSAAANAPTIQLFQNGTANMIGAASNKGSFYLDNGGDVTISGGYTSSSDAYQRTQNPSSDVMSYGAQTTEPTIEDVGSARLTSGATAVPLAGDFRQTIDGSNYMVFITPDGPNHGLYVASKSPAGFVVRENDGGHSTIAFDYRIVAQKYGTHPGRLPHFASIHPDLTKERLAAMRSDALKRYEASRARLAEAKKQSALIRAAMLRRQTPQATPPNPFAVSFSKR